MAGIGVASTAAGCASLGGLPATQHGVADVSSHLAVMDNLLASLERGPILSDLVASLDPSRGAASEAAQRDEELARKMTRALVVGSMYSELSPAQREQSEVQARLHALGSELDEAIGGVTSLFERTSQPERQLLRQRLSTPSAERNTVDRFVSTKLARHGVPLKTREHFDRIRDVAFRHLTEQDPSVLMDDFVSKVRRLEARLAQTQAPPVVIGPVVADPQGQGSVPPPPGAAAQAPQPAVPSEPPQPGRSMVVGGGVTLGIGGALLVGGSIAVALGLSSGLWIVGAFLLTAAGAALITGLVILLVGVGRNGAAASQWRQQQGLHD